MNEEQVAEPWINIYKSGIGVWTSGMFYPTSKRARTKLCNKEKYYCTINVVTGERITKKLN